MSPERGQAAVVQFSRVAKLMINFNNHSSLSGFEAGLDELQHWGETTRIDSGLEVALDQMFQVTSGMRPDVSHTLVLITDGNHTGKKFNYVEYRKRFNEKKIRVLVILVGNVRPGSNIHDLLNRPSDLYIARSYDHLISNEFVHEIILCKGITK